MQSVTGSGRVVAGRYQLLDPVGHGAMGTVWRARDLRLDRDVAVKEVRVPGPMTHQDRNILRERSLREALGSAHAAGVVHRDVKPGNILVTPDGRVVLTDFGIATLHGDPGLTQAGMVMGTPGFTAPERIRGEPATPASDLWSLGATLYAAVEGQGPFAQRGSSFAVLSSIANEDAPRPPSAGGLGP